MMMYPAKPRIETIAFPATAKIISARINITTGALTRISSIAIRASRIPNMTSMKIHLQCSELMNALALRPLSFLY
jgi:hypothetical protein